MTLSLSHQIDHFLSDANITSACDWLIRRRAHHPACADVWDFRFHFSPAKRERLCRALAAREYRLSPMMVLPRRGPVWSANDAMVLKMTENTLREMQLLPVSRYCGHLAAPEGEGRITQMQSLYWLLQENRFVCRTDIKGYYASIDKFKFWLWLEQKPLAPPILEILYQFLHYQTELGGVIRSDPGGIPRASSLSPFLAAAHFFELDEQIGNQTGIVYRRYMDDFLILSASRHKLRRAVRTLNQHCNLWELSLHPDKTCIGKIEKGFDWLGVWYDGTRWSGPSPRSLARSAEKLNQIENMGDPRQRLQRKQAWQASRERWLTSIRRYNPEG